MRKFKTLLLASLLAAGAPLGLASAAPITSLGGGALILNDSSSGNPFGSSGMSILVGDNSVVPNGHMGTTGSATNLSTGFTTPLLFTANTVQPNSFCCTGVPYNSALFGPWTLTFTNSAGGSTNTATETTGSDVGVTLPPFASNVTVSGSGATPTFAWTYPTSSVNYVNVAIFDPTRTNANGAPDLVGGGTFAGTTGSFIVPPTLADGLPLQNHNYIIEFFGITLRDPTLSHPNIATNYAAESEAFFNFTPLPAGAPPDVYLPITGSTGGYGYMITVMGGQTYFVDPTVAVGYSFATGAGNPNFASVIFPAVQTAPFDLSFLYGGTDHGDMVLPGTVFDFPAGGVDAFTVTGIDPADGLDPADTTAFITGLTFVSDGTFTGTQTPITGVVATPEPGSIVLLLSGLLGLRLFWRGRRASLAS